MSRKALRLIICHMQRGYTASGGYKAGLKVVHMRRFLQFEVIWYSHDTTAPLGIKRLLPDGC